MTTAVRASGVVKRATSHSCAARLLEANDIRTARDRLGHDDAGATMTGTDVPNEGGLGVCRP